MFEEKQGLISNFIMAILVAFTNSYLHLIVVKIGLAAFALWSALGIFGCDDRSGGEGFGDAGLEVPAVDIADQGEGDADRDISCSGKRCCGLQRCRGLLR